MQHQQKNKLLTRCCGWNIFLVYYVYTKWEKESKYLVYVIFYIFAGCRQVYEDDEDSEEEEEKCFFNVYKLDAAMMNDLMQCVFHNFCIILLLAWTQSRLGECSMRNWSIFKKKYFSSTEKYWNKFKFSPCLHHQPAKVWHWACCYVKECKRERQTIKLSPRREKWVSTAAGN